MVKTVIYLTLFQSVGGANRRNKNWKMSQTQKDHHKTQEKSKRNQQKFRKSNYGCPKCLRHNLRYENGLKIVPPWRASPSILGWPASYDHSNYKYIFAEPPQVLANNCTERCSRESLHIWIKITDNRPKLLKLRKFF